MNVILMEGITGSGKSCATHRLGLHLRSLGRDVAWWFENDANHPIYPESDHVSYAEEFDSARQAALRERVLARWRALAAPLAGTSRIVIIDCAFLQTTLTHYFLLNLPLEEAARHVEAVHEILAPLDPLLIVIDNADLAATQKRVIQDRSEEWPKYLLSLYEKSPYGRTHSVRDFQGLLEALHHYRAVSDEIVSRLRLRTLRVDTTAGDWAHAYRQMTDALGVPPMAALAPLPEAPGRFAGPYRAAADGPAYHVSTELGEVYLQGDMRGRLLPVSANRFVMLGTHWEVEFRLNDQGTACSARAVNTATGEVEEWTRA